MNDFNKRRAEALGWEYENHKDCGEVFAVPIKHRDWFIKTVHSSFGGFRIAIIDMKFHTSYDWAMLLVKECLEKGLSKFDVFFGVIYAIDSCGSELDFLYATPLQISTAALEVLEASDE